MSTKTRTFVGDDGVTYLVTVTPTVEEADREFQRAIGAVCTDGDTAETRARLAAAVERMRAAFNGNVHAAA